MSEVTKKTNGKKRAAKRKEEKMKESPPSLEMK